MFFRNAELNSDARWKGGEKVAAKLKVNTQRAGWEACALVTLVVGLAGCELTHVCTAIGCSSGSVLSAPVACAPEELASLELSMCLNGECYRGSFSALSALPAPGTGQSVGFPLEGRGESSPTVIVTLWNEGENGSRIEYEWIAADARALKNGDVYRVTATTTDGTSMFDVSRAVTYSESYPNGEDCDAFACKQAAVAVEPLGCGD